MTGELEISTLSVVLIGEFSPTIINPFWLSGKGLIRETEAQNAKIEVIHPELSKFDIGFAFVEVTRNRFEIKSSEEHQFNPIRDLILGIFEILIYTPITAIGINHLNYYQIDNTDANYKFGKMIAPLDLWKDSIDDPRMMFLEIVEEKRRDGAKGILRVRVMPSNIKLTSPYGVLLHVVDEVQNEFSEKPELVTKMATMWEGSRARTTEINKNIWGKFKHL